MRKIIYLIVLAFSLALTLYFYFQYDQAKARLAEANRRLEQQDRQAAPRLPGDSLDTAPYPEDTLTLSPPPSAQFEEELGTLSSSDLERLRRKGLRNPESELQNDLLRKQKSLIPAEGTMGGTMAIRDVRILNDHYALAYFEDGHQAGYMILRFEIPSAGTITWRVVDSYMM
jgi:hypothetical protein